MKTGSGGWTVFQHRFEGKVDFYRNFSEYEAGFGDKDGEFWLGLKHIHELSTHCPEGETILRIDLEKHDWTHGYETFGNFSVSAAPEYTLHLNKGTGTLGVSQGISYNNGMNFYTFDRDSSDINGCAYKDHGGWWYYNCAYANLNGEYLHPPCIESPIRKERIMTYRDFDGHRALRSSKMMMRRHPKT